MSAFALRVFALAAFTAIVALRAPDLRADVPPTYSVDFHAISAGGATSDNSCFHLSATLVQPAPGYSATSEVAPLYSVYAGFWSAIMTAAPDELFFTGFEEC